MLNIEELREEYSITSFAARPKITAREAIAVKNKWSTAIKNFFPASISVPMIPLLPSLPFMSPSMALASTVASGNAFDRLYERVLVLFDGAALVVIVFAGAIWMGGHRSRAVETLMGVCVGYLIVSHATDIRDFLKTI